MKTAIAAFIGVLGFCLSAHAAPLARQLHINEQFFEPLNVSGYGRHDNIYERQESEARLWHKLLREMGFAVEAPGPEQQYAGCNYASAIAVLEQIRSQLGKDHPYQKIWAENQNRVFSACYSWSSKGSLAPAKPSGDNLPGRASSDYEYQLASWYFYADEYDKALQLYKKLIAEETAPMRPYAAYMIARILYYQDKGAEAAHQINAILSDDSLQAVHRIAANYRFIMLWQDRDVAFDARLMEDFLTGLLQEISISPTKAVHLEQSLNNFADAKSHLNRYFPRYDEQSKTVDWWLRSDVKVVSPRMQAVKALAPAHETVDWLQASWAFNVFDRDWLLALHDADAPYWKQNRNVVNHAWKRWLAGDGLEWLEVVLTRIHPQDALAAEALRQAEPYFEKVWKTEGLEYRLWLARLWQNAIRLHLGRKEYAEARKLIDIHQDYRALQGDRSHRSDHWHAETLENSLRWLVYIGEWEEARAFLTTILGQYPQDFTYWRTLLATNWEEAMASAYSTQWSYRSPVGSGSDLWQRMTNLLPAEKLFLLAQDSKIDEQMRAWLANAALTRAMLLERDDEVKLYAALAAKLNPDMREQILSGVERSNVNDYVALMLRIPRLRPTPFALSWQPYGSQRDLLPAAVDTYNHNDNNWWCRYDAAELENKTFAAAQVTPARLWEGFIATEKPNPYAQMQRVQFAKHPYHALISRGELQALEAIPSGSQYLSEAVIKRERWKRWMIWRSEAARNQSASDLHHAVRTTRYGCENNGSHGIYSQGAFKILHQSYGDTVWAKATPYWFR